MLLAITLTATGAYDLLTIYNADKRTLKIDMGSSLTEWLKENVNSRAYVSVMAQYFPTYKAKEDKYLNRKLTNKEYSEIEQYLYLLDIENGYMQDLGKHEEEYVPDF